MSLSMRQKCYEIINLDWKKGAVNRGLREKLGLIGNEPLTIDWDMTPTDTFGIFESWGGKAHIRSKNERRYYFYIDGWKTPARLFLMQRGVKYARVLAQIGASQNMIGVCMASQGKGSTDRSYAIDAALRNWLQDNVIDGDDMSKVIPVESGFEEESLETGLPEKDEPQPAIERVILRSEPAIISEHEAPDIIRRGNFYDSQHNTSGNFTNSIVNNSDSLTVTDLKTGVQWQRSGCDITAIPSIQRYLAALNQQNFAGFNDWQLPTGDMTSIKGQGIRLPVCCTQAGRLIALHSDFRPQPTRRPSDGLSRFRPCLQLVLLLTYHYVGRVHCTGGFHPISSRPCRAYTT